MSLVGGSVDEAVHEPKENLNPIVLYEKFTLLIIAAGHEGAAEQDVADCWLV